MLYRHLNATTKAIFMEPILCPRSRIADPSRILYRGQALLRLDHGGIVEWVVVDVAALYRARRWRRDGVECDKDVAECGGGNVLKDVHVIGQADRGGCAGVGIRG